MLNEKRQALCDEELSQISGGGPKQWYTLYRCSCGHTTTLVGQNDYPTQCGSCGNIVYPSETIYQ